jgi:hypothetical protein
VLLELTVAGQRSNAVMRCCATGSRWSRSPSATGSAAKASTAGWAAIGPAGWRPWPTAPSAIALPQQVPAAVEARLCELRRRHPRWGQRRRAHDWSGSASTHRPG